MSVSRYSQLGWSIIPIKHRSKAALVPWREFQKRRPTEEELKNWFSNGRRNMGVVTGAISGIFVLDVDSKKHPEAEEYLKGKLLPDTLINLTHNGRQYIFTLPDDMEIPNIVALQGVHGIDVKGEGGYILVHPSIHPEGTPYRWQKPKTEPLIKEAPEWLLDAIVLHQQRPPDEGPKSKGKVYDELLYGEVGDGKRDDTITSYAGRLLNLGHPRQEALALLNALNQTRCEPPLKSEEVVKVVDSIFNPPGGGEGASLVCISDVEPETVDWLWVPYIPRGKLTLIEGDPGVGKSWVCLAIATAVSLGKGLPGIGALEPAPVVIASAEDGLGDTIRPRLDALSADVKQIHAVKGALDFSKGGLAMLEEFVHQVEPTLVIIDPLVAYIGAVDIYRANETRAVMARLADMAERHSAAILAIRHLTKSGALKPIYRGIGSIDLTAACRSVLLAGCDPDNPQERGLVQIKSNLAPTGVAIGYELKEGDFFWTGESDLTWQRMVSAEDTDEGKSAVDDAMGFLKEKLAEGPVDAPVVLRDARNAGLSERTVRRAKAKLGVVAKRQGDPGKRGGGKWKWELVD